MKKILSLLVCGAILMGCGMSKTGSGAIIGTSAGAAIGAGIGYLLGGDGSAIAIGAAVGGVVGGGAGVAIGKKMDEKAAELAELENAQVETVTDVNGLKAIKVTFDSGILFDFNKSTLKADAKQQLDKFAAEMSDMPETNFAIYGHTDNIGSEQANQKVSNQRAESVEKYLRGKGIAKERMTAEGLSFNFPVGDNNTEAGRAQNRRVEIFITASEEMVKEAEAGTLQ
jgi:outer membrane protein OmpA-like peptidoglycan-associated protein